MAMSSAERSRRYRDKDVDAYRKKKKEWAKTEKQRKYRREYMRKWREKNREHHNRLCRESQARNAYKHKAINRERHLLREYGITQQRYDEMFIKQDGKCAICGTDEPGGRGKLYKLHVDHNHETSQVRGLLCHSCNTKLGWLETNFLVIKEYLAYDD